MHIYIKRTSFIVTFFWILLELSQDPRFVFSGTGGVTRASPGKHLLSVKNRHGRDMAVTCELSSGDTGAGDPNKLTIVLSLSSH